MLDKMHSRQQLFVVGLIVSLLEVESSSILTSAYAKVAKWGADSSRDISVGEGRSNGQSLYTQRSDVMLRSGQNLNKPKKEEVVYHYSMPAHKVETSRVDAPTKSPGFHDRFNPPPIFLFGDSKRNVPDQSHSHGNVGVVYPEPDSPKKVSYDSPISSYNPVPSGIPDSPKFNFPGPVYPPSTASAPDLKPLLSPGNNDNNGDGSDNDMNYDDSDEKAPNDNEGYQYNGPTPDGYQYDPASKPTIDAYQYNPPTKTPTNGGYQYNPPTQSPISSKPISIYGPPKFPPYVYEHGHDDENMDNHHQETPEDNQPDHQDQPDYQDLPTGQKPHMDKIPEYMDEDPTGKFNYPLFSSFYSDHDHHDHHDHHVYHPITTTTTTTEAPEPEDENRVNKGHYSYYYLGRKLYYVPLYFSVYFIIYITVLILKSIARHKVTFVHDLDNVNKGRGFSGDTDVDEMAERTTTAINSFKRRYIAM